MFGPCQYSESNTRRSADAGLEDFASVNGTLSLMRERGKWLEGGVSVTGRSPLQSTRLWWEHSKATGGHSKQIPLCAHLVALDAVVNLQRGPFRRIDLRTKYIHIQIGPRPRCRDETDLST
jgi:hypothetical protein